MPHTYCKERLANTGAKDWHSGAQFAKNSTNHVPERAQHTISFGRDKDFISIRINLKAVWDYMSRSKHRGHVLKLIPPWFCCSNTSCAPGPRRLEDGM